MDNGGGGQAIADQIEVRRGGRALHALPREVQARFRQAVAGARCGDADTRAAFAAVDVADLLQHAIDIFDLVAAGLAAFDEDDRTAVEIALFGQSLPETGPAALIREVLVRGRADGLDDGQLAGAVTVVLESHGLLARAAA